MLFLVYYGHDVVSAGKNTYLHKPQPTWRDANYLPYLTNTATAKYLPKL
jgi:hypothetical protein